MAANETNRHCVIVVDDSPTVRRVLSRTLERAGYDVLGVESGQEAFELCEQGRPSLVLIDELLPDSTGRELVLRLREKVIADVPLLLTTSRPEPAADGVEDGPDVHHLAKPFSPKELVAVVDKVLEDSPEPGGMRLRLVRTGEDGGGSQEPAADGPKRSQEEFDDLVRKATSAATEPATPPPAPPPAPPPPAPPKENRKNRRRRKRDNEDVTDNLDRLLRKHLEKRIPAIVKGALFDTLRETGLVGRAGVQISGNLTALGLPEVLGFVETVALTGRLAVLCSESYGEVWCESGKFVFASATRPVAGSFLAKLLRDVAGDMVDPQAIQRAIREAQESERRIGEVLREKQLLDDQQLETLLQHQALEAFGALLELSEGMFFFEAMPVPERMNDITSRFPLRSVLMDGLRLLDEKLEAERTLGEDNLVLGRLMSEEQARESFKFTPSELELFDLIDGSATLDELLNSSPLTPLETKRVFARLARVGLVRVRSAA